MANPKVSLQITWMPLSVLELPQAHWYWLPIDSPTCPSPPEYDLCIEADDWPTQSLTKVCISEEQLTTAGTVSYYGAIVNISTSTTNVTNLDECSPALNGSIVIDEVPCQGDFLACPDYVHVGCWIKPTSDAGHSLEPAVNTSHEILLNRNYKDRPEAILRCGLTARLSTTKTNAAFTLHKGGQCQFAETDSVFTKGPTDSCEDGKGGTDSTDIYILQSEDEFIPFWTQWSPWSSCTAGCEGGVTERGRYCVAAEDQTCDGEPGGTLYIEEVDCNNETCPWNIMGPKVDPVYQSLGCWKHPTSLSTSLEDQGLDILDGNAKHRTSAVDKCAVVAYTCNKTGAIMFGVQNGQCWIADGNDTVCYRDEGPTYDCTKQMAVYIFVDKDPTMSIDGQWGPWEKNSICSKPCGTGEEEEVRQCDNPKPSNDGLDCVGSSSQLTPCNTEPCPEEFAFKSIGCWLDGDPPVLRSLEMMSDHLDKPVSDRKDPVMKCAYVAFMEGFTVFGIKDGGFCYSSLGAECIFDKYGTSTTCSKGLGSPDSLNMYSLDTSVPNITISLSYKACRTDSTNEVDDQLRYVENAEHLGISQSIAVLMEFQETTDIANDPTSGRPVSGDTLGASRSILLETASKTMVREAQSAEEVNAYVTNFVEASSQLLDDTYGEAWTESPEDSSDMLLAVETFSRSLSSYYTDVGSVQIDTDNLKFEALTVRTDDVEDDGGLILPQQPTSTQSNKHKYESSVTLPEDFLEQLESKASKSELTSVDNPLVFTSIAIYDNLDKWLPQDIQADQTENTTKVNSKLVTVITEPALEGPFKGNPIVLNMQHTERLESPEKSIVSCVFWQYDSSNDASGMWSSDGCTLASTNVDTTVCYCNHLTSFAVLVKVTDVEKPEAHKVALSIITYVCTIISLIALGGAFLIFTYLNNLNADRTTIHKNLIVALGLAQLLFLVGIDQTPNKNVCTAIACFLHFFYTAAFSWMLCEGLHLYCKVVQVFSHGKTLSLYYAVGWGLPIIIVAISVGIKSDGYGTDHYCWLSLDGGLIWAFVGPMLVIILVNVIIMILVIRIIINSSSGIPGQDVNDKMKLMRAGVKGIAILTPILGLTWLFGILAVHENILFFEYLFDIFNCLQGFFIFVFHCVGSSEVRAAYQRKQEQRSLSKHHSVGSTGTKPSLAKNQKQLPTSNTTLRSTLTSAASKKVDEKKNEEKQTDERKKLGGCEKEIYEMKTNEDPEYDRSLEPWLKPLRKNTTKPPASPTPSIRSSVSLDQDMILLESHSAGSGSSDAHSTCSNRSNSRLLTPLGAFDDCVGLAGVETPRTQELSSAKIPWRYTYKVN